MTLSFFLTQKKDHVRDVKEVLQRMRKHSLHIKLEKCDFFKNEVEFCGHMINGEGVRIATSKIAALSQPPPFRSKKDVEKFLGVTVWFQDFIQNYASILQPVTDLLRKDASFDWTKETERAVTEILQAISNAPVLKHFDPILETKVWTDASQFAIAGWISQKHPDGWHPVVFVSRKLTTAELNYSNPERELLALVYKYLT